ncbi:MAG: tRNA lysidine(34) synthetase TilS [Bacteroidetes bacterium]|nr:tRNA lysidine(34) synthetase TilS [Bacteroidota bacterium]MBU1718664.1 tRNA lysidine(34) synthetase TilS [Bacteroidota bacterium]
MLLKDFRNHIEQPGLQKYTGNTLLTVSGGADSVVMAWLFYRSGKKFGIAHCNFCLRGSESDGDEIFVRELAEQLKVPFFVTHFDTKKEAESRKLSIQEAARDLRYEWFSAIATENGYTAIATAHHSDDVAETVLLNLIRGTGIRGLSGIPEQRGNIIRPMLFASAEQIKSYAENNGIAFRTDSSNADEKYARNLIRHSVLPVLEKVKPGASGNIVSSANHIGQYRDMVSEMVVGQRNLIFKRKKDKIIIPLDALFRLKPMHTWMFELLGEFGFNGAQVSDIISSFDGQSGKVFHSATHSLFRDRSTLVVVPGNHRYATQKESCTETIWLLSESGPVITGELKLCIEKVSKPAPDELDAGNNSVFVDADKLTFPLIVRKWRQGDYFYPLGLNGKKKVSTFLINKKMPRHEKMDVWMVYSGEKAVWLAGHRLDDRFRVGEKTQNVVKISLTVFNQSSVT